MRRRQVALCPAPGHTPPPLTTRSGHFAFAYNGVYSKGTGAHDESNRARDRQCHRLGLRTVLWLVLCLGCAFQDCGFHLLRIRIGNDHPPVIPPIVIGMVGKIAGHVWSLRKNGRQVATAMRRIAPAVTSFSRNRTTWPGLAVALKTGLPPHHITAALVGLPTRRFFSVSATT
jgi:hypothetical protein